MRVGYCRVSTVKTAQDISIDGQRQQLEEAGCDLVISERASAYKGQRKGWNELWALVAAKQVTEVLTIDQSRLSRSGDDLEFLELCALHSVKVSALSGGTMEVDSYTGFLTAGILSVMNKGYSKMLGVKASQGVARRKAAGYFACSKAPFGYCVSENQLVPHPTDFATARKRIEDLMAMEMNISGYIRANKIDWSVCGMHRWIRNSILRGMVDGRWGAVEPLISFSEWERIEAMLKIRSKLRGTSGRGPRIFTGLVKCLKCGKNLGQYCATTNNLRRIKCLYAPCEWYGRGVRESVLREQVIQTLSLLHKDLATLANQREVRINPEVEKIKAEIAQLVTLQHLPGIESLIDGQKKQLIALEKQPAGDDGMNLKLLNQLFSDPEVLSQATDDELRALVIEFVSQITWLSGAQFEIALR